MRVTKKIREEAALLCSAAASCEALGHPNAYVIADEWLWDGPAWLSPHHWLGRIMRVDPRSVELADEAHQFVLDELPPALYVTRETWAEAEALLRTGWEPT